MLLEPILGGELSVDLNRIHLLVSAHKWYSIDIAIPKIYFFLPNRTRDEAQEKKMRSGCIDGVNLAGK